MFRIRRPGRLSAPVLAAIIALALALPLGALAVVQKFSDVPPSSSFFNDINAIADAGVTGGCGGGKYCPKANVTREQMAAFMNRLGALQSGKTPVVNAKTSQSTDGFSIGCPSNTVYSQGLCFEKTNRAAATVFAASDTCAGLSGLFGSGWRYRLPSTLELRGARNVTGIDLDASGEWTDSIQFEGSAAYSIAVLDNGGVNRITTGTSLKFRCAAPPLSIDFVSLILLGGTDQYPASPAAPSTTVGADGAPVK